MIRRAWSTLGTTSAAGAAALLLIASLAGPDRARAQAAAAGADGASPVAIVIHGGAGTILPENMTPERERRYRDRLEEALRAGHDVLTGGGSSLDAVVAAIRVMEESPLFNAAKGAVFTSEGTVELDASIMDGRTHDAGAVTGVKHVASPIRLARLVMEESKHVFMAQEGAEAFAWTHGMDSVPNSTFYTERRREQWRESRREAEETGTVGAAALDRDGDLAAGTSTGGLTNKRFGRIGDSPVIGAGTYADNATAAISATGHGEYFIRGVISHDVAAMMRYTGLGLAEAANAVIHGKLTGMGATGGLIALDRRGNVATPFNTPGMYRGWIGPDGDVVVKIYRD